MASTKKAKPPKKAQSSKKVKPTKSAKPSKKAKTKAKWTAAKPLMAAAASAVVPSPGSWIDVSSSGSGQFGTVVLVKTSKGAAGQWSDLQVHPGPHRAFVPGGEVWQLDFISRCMNAAQVTDSIVEDPGTPSQTMRSKQLNGAAGSLVTWRTYVIG